MRDAAQWVQKRVMERVHYAGSSILTGSAIAHALLDYAQALAEVGTSATTQIPTLNDDGTPGMSEVLIGPASQLIADTEESPYDEVVDDELVARLRRAADRVRNDSSPSPAALAIDDDPRNDTSVDEF